MKRRGRPEDIATAVVFFAGGGSGVFTGQRIAVGGGWGLHWVSRHATAAGRASSGPPGCLIHPIILIFHQTNFCQAAYALIASS